MEWVAGYFGIGVVVVGLSLYLTWDEHTVSIKHPMDEHAMVDGSLVLMMTVGWGMVFWPLVLMFLPMGISQWLFRRSHPGKKMGQY